MAIRAEVSITIHHHKERATPHCADGVRGFRAFVETRAARGADERIEPIRHRSRRSRRDGAGFGSSRCRDGVACCRLKSRSASFSAIPISSAGNNSKGVKRATKTGLLGVGDCCARGRRLADRSRVADHAQPSVKFPRGHRDPARSEAASSARNPSEKIGTSVLVLAEIRRGIELKRRQDAEQTEVSDRWFAQMRQQ